MIYGDAMEALSSCVRGMLIPSKGKMLYAADYDQIEARITPWLAGQDDALEVFRRGEDIYMFTAAEKVYNKPVESITKDERFVGKTATLSLGFGGGAKAFLGMAANYGVENITEAQAEHVKQKYRRANPKIVQMWRNCEKAVKYALNNPGHVVSVRNKLHYFFEGKWLWCKLPSGRKLAYYKPRLQQGKYGMDVTYMGRDIDNNNKYSRIKGYGGKFFQNGVQGIAADILRHGMVNVARSAFDMLLSVHDEVIAEADPHHTVDELVALMTDVPVWAEGLPITADGFKAERYRK